MPNLIFCLFKTLRKIEEDGVCRARINWDELISAMESILFSQDPRLRFSHSKANELRVCFENWIYAQLVSASPELIAAGEPFRVRDMRDWENRIRRAGRNLDHGIANDSIGIALYHLRIALELMNRSHHDGMRHFSWQGNAGEKVLEQIVYRMIKFIELISARPVSRRLIEFTDFINRPICKGRFIVLKEDASADDNPSIMACLEQGTWYGTIEFNQANRNLLADIKDDDIIFIYGLTLVDGALVAGENALLVHHPDFMLAVTDLSECYPGYVRDGDTLKPIPLHIIKSYFAPRGASRMPTIVGQIVTNVMDRALQCRNDRQAIDRESIILDAISDNLLDIASLESNQAFRDKISNLKKGQVPSCPDHNTEMRLCDGPNGQFYGCVNYPACNRTENLTGLVGYNGLNEKIFAQMSQEQGVAYWEVPVHSSDLGITGKIDLLLQSPTNDQMMKYVELKTGKVYGNDPGRLNYLNPQHAKQLQMYKKLSEERFGATRLELWYPRARRNWIREVSEIADDETFHLMRLRNKALSFIVKFATRENVWGILREITTNENLWIQSLEGTTRCKLNDVIENSNSLVRSYAEFMVSFIAQSMLSARLGWYSSGRNGSFADIWLARPEEKMEKGVMLNNLELTEIAYGNGKHILSLEYSSNGYDFKFRENDFVMLYPVNIDASGAPLVIGAPPVILEGFIKRLGHKEVTGQGDLFPPIELDVSVSSYVPEIKQWKDKLVNGGGNLPRFAIERSYSEKSHKSQFKGVSHYLVNMEEGVKNVFLGLTPPSRGNGSNDIEKAADTDSIYLVQGPPGSGKTRELIPSLIGECLIKRHNEKILIVAMSNQAVYEIAKSLHTKEIDFIHIGAEPETSRAQWISSHSLKRMLRDAEKLPFMQRFNRIGVIHDKLISAPVLISTVASVDEKIFQFRTSGTLIVDEASQLHECQLLTVLSHSKRVILIGDHKQLPPVHEIELSPDLLPEDLSGIGFATRPGASIMERLWRLFQHKKWNWACHTLNKQYRMHDQIQTFINSRYYNNMLQCGHERHHHTDFLLHNGIGECNNLQNTMFLSLGVRNNRTLWIDVIETNEADQREKENNVVIDLLKLLNHEYENSIKIGIVMPFRMQIQRLTQSLSRENDMKEFKKDHLRIDTVERFQGGECDIIIISTGICDSSKLKTLQAIMPADPDVNEPEIDCKLNVAWSRAKEQVIVVGNSNALRASPHYRALRESIKTRFKYQSNGRGDGAYVEETIW